MSQLSNVYAKNDAGQDPALQPRSSSWHYQLPVELEEAQIRESSLQAFLTRFTTKIQKAWLEAA